MDVGVSFFLPTVGAILIVLINWAIPVALLCILQYFLSKMESPWPGRALPILSGVYALGLGGFMLFNLVSMLAQDHAVTMDGGSAVCGVLVWIVIMCLPAVFFSIIYRRTHRNLITKKNMEKMSIQDLE